MTAATLRFTEIGRGEAVLVLGPTWCPVSYSQPLGEALASAGFRVLIASFPGYDGTPPREPGTRTLDDDRALLERSLAAAGIEALAAVVGSSLGGYRALSLACARTVPVRCLVTLGGFAELSAEERAGMAGFAGAIRAGHVPAQALSQVAFSPAWAAAHPGGAREADGWLSTVDAGSVAWEYDALAQCPSILDAAGALSIPLLARAGADDAAVPALHTQALARVVSGATLQLVARAGHLLLLEDESATVEAVTAFVTRPTPG